MKDDLCRYSSLKRPSGLGDLVKSDTFCRFITTKTRLDCVWAWKWTGREGFLAEGQGGAAGQIEEVGPDLFFALFPGTQLDAGWVAELQRFPGSRFHTLVHAHPPDTLPSGSPCVSVRELLTESWVHAVVSVARVIADWLGSACVCIIVSKLCVFCVRVCGSCVPSSCVPAGQSAACCDHRDHRRRARMSFTRVGRGCQDERAYNNKGPMKLLIRTNRCILFLPLNIFYYNYSFLSMHFFKLLLRFGLTSISNILTEVWFC